MRLRWVYFQSTIDANEIYKEDKFNLMFYRWVLYVCVRSRYTVIMRRIGGAGAALVVRRPPRRGLPTPENSRTLGELFYCFYVGNVLNATPF